MSDVADAGSLPRPQQADVRVRPAVGVLQRLAAASSSGRRTCPKRFRSTSSGCTVRGRRSASRCCFGHSSLPFLLLLSRALKRNAEPRRQCVALFILLDARRRHHLDDRPGVPARGRRRCTGSTSRWSLGMGGVVAVLLLAQPGRPRARAGARPVLQGSDGSWRTLITPTRRPTPPVEGDGVSYSGIVWFVVDPRGDDAGVPGADVGLFVLFDANRQPAGERAPAGGARCRTRASRAAASSTGTRARRSRRCSSNEPTELDAVPRDAKTRSCTTTAGWTRPPASCGFRSIAPRSCCSSEGFPVAAAPAAARSRQRRRPRQRADDRVGWHSDVTRCRAMRPRWRLAWLLASCAPAAAQPSARRYPCRRRASRRPSRFRSSRTSASIRSSTRRCRSTSRSWTKTAAT